MASKTLKVCVDKLLTPKQREKARELAIKENPDNAVGGETGAELALETRTLWKPGRVLRVRFLDGVPSVQAKVEKYAHMWEKYANVKLVFGNDPKAEIRISFKQEGSWSYLGTDALSIPKTQPTMNYGWLKPNTPEEEYSRVVLHEFGHALGCIHEHQHPKNGIQWNKEAVYRYFAQQGWSKAQVDFNMFQKYGQSQTQFSRFDKKSIMLYPIRAEWTLDGFSTGWNTALSLTDRRFIKKTYPAS